MAVVAEPLLALAAVGAAPRCQDVLWFALCESSAGNQGCWRGGLGETLLLWSPGGWRGPFYKESGEKDKG